MFLTIVGLLVLGGIAYGVVRALDKPENVAVAAPEVVEVQAEPTLEPVTLKDPSAFLAAMPPTVGPYSMTKAATLDPEKTTLTTRAAEVDDLTYSDGTTTLACVPSSTMTWPMPRLSTRRLAKDGTDPQPVTVGDKKVGQRVTIEGDPTKYVWRNGTAVFVLRGPAEALEGFWIQFPL
ncbi:hypothetical protein [Demequina litorisediminis]|uniref:Uncharacterized protein n=1 Tax=Demequina litorisediminis TaxID=1849022 RepID=A0ABQ6IDI4_9MICO|nr:hypothetical protein [Demequina litorisediminis]GMA35918.1 hypothetical protein GCM10025876_21220 [Demequina litorisediminis]